MLSEASSDEDMLVKMRVENICEDLRMFVEVETSLFVYMVLSYRVSHIFILKCSSHLKSKTGHIRRAITGCESILEYKTPQIQKILT